MSSETKFTPGPWQVSGVRHKWREAGSDQVLDSHTVGPDGDAVALIFYAPKWHIEQLANARLIAAAPEIYAALKAIDALFAEPLCCLIRKMHGSITNGDQDVIDAAFGKMMHALAKVEQP